MDYLATHTSLSPIWPGFVNYKKGCNRLATASDKVYQLLAHGRWFSLGNPASSTIKTGRHDIAEILLKVVLSTQKKSKNQCVDMYMDSSIVIYGKSKEFQRSLGTRGKTIYLLCPRIRSPYHMVFLSSKSNTSG